MQSIHHIMVMTILFFTGIILFTINVFNALFIKGLVIFLLFLVSINIYGIATRSIMLKGMTLMVAVSLLFVGVSVFGLFAVEETAVGYKTLYDFSINGIAASLIILFLSSFFFAISVNIKDSQQIKEKKRSLYAKQTRPELSRPAPKEVFPDGWEEATEEDLRSDKYIY